MPIGPVTPGSPVNVTADADPLPYTQITASTATMPVASVADVQTLALELMNSQHGTLNFAALPAATGYPSGARVFVRGFNSGEYRRVPAGVGFASDGKYLVDSADGGQWVHESWYETRNFMFPSVGPVPGELTTGATPAGRINHQFIPFGRVYHVVHTPVTGTNTRAFADPFTIADELTGDALGAVNVGDTIIGHIHAGVYCVNDFRIGVWITQDGGTTYKLVTPQVSATLPPDWLHPATFGTRVSVDLSFAYEVGASPAPTFAGYSIRAQGAGALLTANLSSYIVEVNRL